jgi:hypothetical protein
MLNHVQSSYLQRFSCWLLLLACLLFAISIPTQEVLARSVKSSITQSKAFESALNDVQQQQLSQWEQQLLGLNFIQEADARRVGRLEFAVFGRDTRVKPTPSLTQRIGRLQAAMVSTQPKYPTSLISAMEKRQDATVQQGDAIVFDGRHSKNPPLQNQEALPNLEKKLIGTVFTNDTMENRLRRLELKVFGSVANQEEQAVSDQQRLDRLIAVADANPRGGVGDLKRDRFLQQALPIILTSLLFIL